MLVNFGLDVNIVSPCCHAPIEQGSYHDPYPLGRGEYNGHGITYLTLDCSACGHEVDDLVEQCGICGEEDCYNECEEEEA